MVFKRCVVILQAQFPKCKGAQEDGYSHCPAPASDGVLQKILELGPSSLIPVPTCPEVQQVSMFGCAPDMCRTAFELLGCGVLKYTGKGSREFTCVSLDNAVKMMETICEKQGRPTPEAKPGNPLLKVLASFLHDGLDKNGLAQLGDVPGLVAYRGMCPPGSLCFMPSGCIFSERTLNGVMAHGWRCSVVEHHDALKVLQALANDGFFGARSVDVLKKLIKAAQSRMTLAQQ